MGIHTKIARRITKCRDRATQCQLWCIGAYESQRGLDCGQGAEFFVSDGWAAVFREEYTDRDSFQQVYERLSRRFKSVQV
jgi:hypothetical protein